MYVRVYVCVCDVCFVFGLYARFVASFCYFYFCCFFSSLLFSFLLFSLISYFCGQFNKNHLHFFVLIAIWLTVDFIIWSSNRLMNAWRARLFNASDQTSRWGRQKRTKQICVWRGFVHHTLTNYFFFFSIIKNTTQNYNLSNWIKLSAIRKFHKSLWFVVFSLFWFFREKKGCARPSALEVLRTWYICARKKKQQQLELEHAWSVLSTFKTMCVCVCCVFSSCCFANVVHVGAFVCIFVEYI